MYGKFNTHTNKREKAEAIAAAFLHDWFFDNKQDKFFKKQPQQETPPNQIARPIAKEYIIESLIKGEIIVNSYTMYCRHLPMYVHHLPTTSI